MADANPYTDPGLRQAWAEGKDSAVDKFRSMLKIMALDHEPDIARCASLLLEGFDGWRP